MQLVCNCSLSLIGITTLLFVAELAGNSVDVADSWLPLPHRRPQACTVESMSFSGGKGSLKLKGDDSIKKKKRKKKGKELAVIEDPETSVDPKVQIHTS